MNMFGRRNYKNNFFYFFKMKKTKKKQELLKYLKLSTYLFTTIWILSGFSSLIKYKYVNFFTNIIDMINSLLGVGQFHIIYLIVALILAIMFRMVKRQNF